MSQGFRTCVLLAVPAVLAGTAPRADDARIEAAAKRSYTFKVHLKGDAVQVSARDGTVTLTGSVADGYHSTLAEETVADLPGVRAVDNRLTVRGEVPPQKSDAWLATKVRTALLFQRNVDAGSLRVDVKDRVATLSGQASSLARKELAADVARNVDGVERVDNRIRVGGGPDRRLAERIDDASVTAQVKAALLFHKGTHMLATHVRTVKGVVTVDGNVRDPAERDLVTRVVAGVRGVRRVENRMSAGGT